MRHGRVERRVDWSGDDGGRVDVEDGPRRDSDSANALCRRGAGASFKCLNGRHPRGGNAAAHRTLVRDVRVALGAARGCPSIRGMVDDDDEEEGDVVDDDVDEGGDEDGDKDGDEDGDEDGGEDAGEDGDDDGDADDGARTYIMLMLCGDGDDCLLYTSPSPRDA